MRIGVVLFLAGLTSVSLLPSAHAQGILSSMRCILASAPPGAEEWREQAFPLIRTSDGFEAAASVGSAQIFELTPIAASQLRGWPIYEGGRYFSGGNDVWVIIPNGDVIKVIKPLETDPNTKQLPAVYICKT